MGVSKQDAFGGGLLEKANCKRQEKRGVQVLVPPTVHDCVLANSGTTATGKTPHSACQWKDILLPT